MAYQNMTFVEYRDHYHGQAAHILVDVRTAGEFRQGHVPGAINIPLDQLAKRSDEIAKGHPVVVICASGNRSKRGATILQKAGHDTVYNLQGGTMVWMMNGLPLEG